MATPEIFNVHDITQNDQPYFAPNGTVQKQTHVRFWVGNHGPFTLTYDAGQATADNIQRDINAKVRDLRTITSADYNG